MKDFRILYLLGVALIVADVAYNLITHPKHDFSWEFPTFSAFFGFVMCVVLIYFSKFIGRFIMKEEDYYEKFRKVR